MLQTFTSEYIALADLANFYYDGDRQPIVQGYTARRRIENHNLKFLGSLADFGNYVVFPAACSEGIGQYSYA